MFGKAKLLSLFAAALMAALSISPAKAASDPEELVMRSTVTLRAMLANPDFSELRGLMAKSRGVLVVPKFFKAAFLIGGEGGSGVLIARGQRGWSAPAFYTMGGASVGLQIGGQSSEVVFVVMSDKAMNAISNGQLKLGGDISFAFGAIGKGLSAATAFASGVDIYAVANTEGLFAGGALSGSYISAREEWNRLYYGDPTITLRSILNQTGPVNPYVQALQQSLP